MTSIVNLAPLTAGSRQVCFSIVEGVPFEFDSAAVCNTASYSSVGVSTRLRLVAYTEDQSVKAAGGCSFLKAAAKSTGAATLIPLPHSEAERMDLFKGEFSDGTTSVTISSSRQVEPVLFCYDPISYAASTATLQDGFKMAFTEVVDAATDLGTVAWASAFPQNVTTSDIVITRETSSGNYFCCVRRHTQLARDVFASALDDAAGASSFGSKAVRFSAEAPVPGLGFAVFESSKKELYLAADIHLNSADIPITFSIDAAVAPAGSVISDAWIAFKLTSLTTTGLSGNLLSVFFGTLTPPLGSISTTNVLRCVAKVSPLGHKRVIKTVWNAEQVFGAQNPYGGATTY